MLTLISRPPILVSAPKTFALCEINTISLPWNAREKLMECSNIAATLIRTHTPEFGCCWPSETAAVAALVRAFNTVLVAPKKPKPCSTSKAALPDSEDTSFEGLFSPGWSSKITMLAGTTDGNVFRPAGAGRTNNPGKDRKCEPPRAWCVSTNQGR